MQKKITSRDNPHAKRIIALTSDAKERRKYGQFVAEGLRTCATLIEHGMQLEQLYILEAMILKINDLPIDQDKIILVSQFVMEKMSSATSPSGIIGLFAIPAQIPPQNLSSGLVIASMTDPGNMGTLIRTSAAMGAHSVICVEGVDPWNSKVIQASAGTIAQVQIFQWSWSDLLTHKKDFVLYALMPLGGKDPHAINAQKALIVVGNEAHGIPQGWLKDCNSQVTIRMPGQAESLNAAIAGSIALYEIFGKR
jgi:TrmH family RNA methyltransferase